MTVSEIMKRMIDASEGNLHDINHFVKVHSFARTIGELEGLNAETQLILEVAAIIHDIACPLCREKYGNTNGKHQEREGMPLTEAFLEGTGLTREQIDRVVYLVGHHHTFTGINGPDYQILVEADFLVNADESGYSRDMIENFDAQVFKTATGRQLLRSIYKKTC